MQLVASVEKSGKSLEYALVNRKTWKQNVHYNEYSSPSEENNNHEINVLPEENRIITLEL